MKGLNRYIGIPTLAKSGFIILAMTIALLLTWGSVAAGSGDSLKRPNQTSQQFVESRSVIPNPIAVEEPVLAQSEGVTNTLRVYGRAGEDAAFPYATTNYTGPFALTNAEAPPKDFVQFNPAIMIHTDDDSLGQFDTYFGGAIKAGVDASEKVHLRMWYVPKYPEPRGLTYPPVTQVYNPEGDIVLEYTYILLDPASLDPQTGPPQSTLMVFPMAGLGEQPGLDRMDVNGDGLPETLSIDDIVGVGTITYTDGISDNQTTTHGIIEVSPQAVLSPMHVPDGGQVQFLDYMVKLEGVSLSGSWADVSVWYIGNDTPSLLDTVRLSLDEAALVGRFWGPTVEKFNAGAEAKAAAEAVMVSEGLPARPFWVTLDSIVQSDGQLQARLTPHRLLMTGETFFVDRVEYDVAAILVEDSDLNIDVVTPEIKYITIRNPLPKGVGVVRIPELTVDKCKIPANESLWMLPPFNYQHDMVDDVNIPEKTNSFGPDLQQLDNDATVETYIADNYDLVEERIVEDVLPLDGDLFIGWVSETKENRFDTNLAEEKFIQTQDGNSWVENWQWINIETWPWSYTKFILPELPDKPTEEGYTSGDYVLVSSFLTEDSATTIHGAGAVRLKFVYDAQVDASNSADIYVNNADSQSTLRVYGRLGLDAAFPYASTNYTGPFALTNAEAPPKDFVQFNPAIMLHDDKNSLGQFGDYFGGAIKAGIDASEKVHLRVWYVPKYPEPRGLTYPSVTQVYNPDGDIVIEYTYILLHPASLDPQTGPPQSTLMVFPMAGLGEQPGLDRMDVNGDGLPETLSIDDIVGVDAITITDGITDNLKTTHGTIAVSPQGVLSPTHVPDGGQVQFLDYMVKLDGVSLSGSWADVSVWYIGNGTPSFLDTVRLSLDEAALVGRFWGPTVEVFSTEAEAKAAAEAFMVSEGLPARPFWVTLDSIVQSGGQLQARLTPHRLLMTGETFFVDCVEYDVAAILVEDANLGASVVWPEIKYISLRNPLPKGEGIMDIPELTVEKCRIPANESLWMLPPFNYQHDMVDDVNIPKDIVPANLLDPDEQNRDNPSAADLLFDEEDINNDDYGDLSYLHLGYNTIEERVVEDVPSLDGDLFIGWTAETKESRFDSNLLEEKFIQAWPTHYAIQCWDEDWQWINIETTPWDYVEFILPELPDKPTAARYTTGDYVLVSSFLTEDSITTTHGAGAVRVKFAYDARYGAGIYVDTCSGSLKDDFHGRVKLESAAYQPLTLMVNVVAGNSIVVSETMLTNASGYFTMALDAGTYDIWVKEEHSLGRRIDSVVATAGAIIERDFGELLVGDANDDNLVDIDDFGIWKATFGSTTTLRADFDLDGVVDIDDFGWIKKNFGKVGDDPLGGPSLATVLFDEEVTAGQGDVSELSPDSVVTISLDPAASSVTPGDTFTVAIKMATGDQDVDSAQAFVDFDPAYLEVVEIAGGGALDEVYNVFDNVAGEIGYAGVDLAGAVSGTFGLAMITFQAKEAIPGTVLTFSIASPRETKVKLGTSTLTLDMQPATVEILGAGVGVSIEPASRTVHAGDTFTLAVRIEAGTQELDGVQTFVNFDPVYVEVTGITGGGVLSELYNDFDNALGQADYAGGDLLGTVSGTFTLATITFQADDTLTGETLLTFNTDSPRETKIKLGTTTLEHTLNGGEVVITLESSEHSIYLPLLTRNYERLQANFDADPSSGMAPLTVSFANTSTGNPTGSRWNFGDGDGSTQVSPTHVYDEVGTYTVTLTISKDSGTVTLPDETSTLVRPSYITVLDTAPPNEPSNPTPADGATCQSVDVDLSWTGGDPDGDDVTYDVYLEADDATPDVLVSDDQSGTGYDPDTLAADTHYYWQIVATDEHGATTDGPVWDFTTCNAPAAPSDLQATPVSSSQIRLDWQDNSSDEDGFEIYGGVTVEPDTTSYTVGGLSPGSYNCFLVRAFNEHGNSAWSDWACTTTPACDEGVSNGGFEDDSAWEFPDTPYPAGYTTTVVHAGNRSARAGIVDLADQVESYSAVRQTVTVPADAVSATLRFWLYPVSGEPPANLRVPARPLAARIEDVALVNDRQYVLVLNENDDWIRTLVWQRTNEQAWVFHEFDMMVHAGHTIKLQFGAYNDNIDGVTSMYVDDVSLEICLPAAQNGASIWWGRERLDAGR